MDSEGMTMGSEKQDAAMNIGVKQFWNFQQGGALLVRPQYTGFCCVFVAYFETLYQVYVIMVFVFKIVFLLFVRLILKWYELIIFEKSCWGGAV